MTGKAKNEEPAPPTCAVRDCDKPVFGRDVCRGHWLDAAAGTLELPVRRARRPRPDRQ